MRRLPARITPTIVEWARKRAGFSLEDLADKVRREPQEIESWEKGSAYPTWRQAERLAKQLMIPFGYLFLSDPPDEDVPLPDLRTLPISRQTYLSLDFREVMNDALVKQEWYRTFLIEEGNDPVEFVGSVSMDDDPNAVAAYIRGELEIDNGWVANTSNFDGFLRGLIVQTEVLGVIVMRSGVVGNNNRRKLSVQEFRGFAISDEFAPLIFINGNDARAAQIFTLAHELTHIAIGESGISNEYLGDEGTKNEIEIFCNQVAAEVLVPSEFLLASWDNKRDVLQNVDELRRRYRVSSLVILRRAFDLGKVSSVAFRKYYREEEERQQRPGSSSGGNFFNTLPSRNSRTLTAAVVGAALDGKLPYREAARFLSVRVETVFKLAEAVGVSD